MNEVQEFILRRAMQKVASEKYQPDIDVDNPTDYMKYPGRTVRVKNEHGGYDYITNPNKVDKNGIQTLMAPRIMRTNAQGDYINADGTVNGFFNNTMKRFKDATPEQAPQNQSALKDNPTVDPKLAYVEEQKKLKDLPKTMPKDYYDERRIATPDLSDHRVYPMDPVGDITDMWDYVYDGQKAPLNYDNVDVNKVRLRGAKDYLRGMFLAPGSTKWNRALQF